MNKIDFSDINKFLVSIGLILYGFAVLIPWLYLKEGLSSTITNTEYIKLTEPSKNLVDVKLSYLNSLIKFIPWITVFLIVIGTVSIIFGIRKWQKKQLILDEKEELELQALRLKLKLEYQTEEEKLIQVKQEVFEEKNESDLEKVSTYEVEEVIRIEKQFHDRIISFNPPRHIVRKDVRFNNRYEIDILLESKIGHATSDRIFDIKYFQHNLSFQQIAKNSDRLKSALVEYNQETGKNIVGHLFIIYKDSINSTFDKEKLEEKLNQIDSGKIDNGIWFYTHLLSETRFRNFELGGITG